MPTAIQCSCFRALAKAAAAAGHEFLVQGWEHNYFWDMSVEEQAEGIDRTMAVFRENGIKFTGFTTPAATSRPESFPLAAERGFKYCCGLRNVDVPFIMRVGGRKLVGQTSYAISDFSSYSTGDMVPRDVTNTWRDCFDALYEEGQRGHPKMLAFGTHPILAHGYRTRPIEDLIGYVKSKPKVWITTRGEITDWVLENYPDHDLAKFYPEAVASDKYYGLGIGLGGQEAIEEAQRYRKGWPQNK